MSTFTSHVRRTLAAMATERAPSVFDYSDHNLTTILGADSAARLLREVIEDHQMLESVAQGSYAHSNGFDKITLISNHEPEFKLRLHAWWSKRNDSTKQEFIHNHRWFFTSSTLCGAAYVEIFEEDGSGELMWRYVYSPRDDAAEKYQLKVDGTRRLTSNLTLKLAPGSVYSMSGDALHRVLCVGDALSITMFVRWGSIRPTATVFSESEIMDEQLLSVPSFTPAETRLKLERIMAELSREAGSRRPRVSVLP